MSNDSVSFEWVAPASKIRETRTLLEDDGAQLSSESRPFVPPKEELDDYSSAAFDPLTIIVGTMALVAIAERVASLVKDARHDGLIVDARTQELQIRPHPALDRGTALVITSQGAQQFSKAESSALSEAIRALMGK